MELKTRFDQKGHAIVTVNFDEKEMQKYLDASTQDLAKNLSIKGFRKGKVDVETAKRYIKNEDLTNNLINRLFRKSLKAINTNNDVINTFYYKMLLNVDPRFNIVKLDPKGSEIEVIILLSPQVTKLGEFKNVKVEYEKEKLSDAKVEEELKRLQEQDGVYEPSQEPIVSDDLVSLKIQVYLNKEKRKDLDVSTIDVKVGSHQSLLGEKEEELLNKKVGDQGVIEFTTDDKYPEQLRNSHVEIKYEIVQVQKMKLPCLDDEFAKSQTSYKDVETLEELKKMISESLKERIENLNKDRKITAIINKIVKESEFEYDAEQLKKELVRIQRARDVEQLEQQGITLEDYLNFHKMSNEEYEEKVYSYLFEPLCRNAVYKRIVDDNPEVFKPVEEKQICEKYKLTSLQDYIKNTTEQYRKLNIDEKQIAEYVKNSIDNMYNDYRTQQIIEYILDNNK